MKSLINLIGKTILVTGAASGIGRETSILASQFGAKVVLIDLVESGLKETLSLLDGNNHSYYILDLTNFSAIETVMKTIFERYGIIHGLVHCAGISSRKPLKVLKKKGFEKVMDVNFYSFLELVRLSCEKKHFADGGSVVVMSSISSIKGYKAKTEYCVSKAAIDAFVRCMALELSERRIRVNSVMPATVNTPMAQKARDLNTSIGATNENDAPLGITEPYEVANLIVFLLSDATKTITGTSILIDGGLTV